MCVMAPRVHHVAARQRTRRAAGIAMARRRKNFIVQPYMVGCVASKLRKCYVDVGFRRGECGGRCGAYWNSETTAAGCVGDCAAVGVCGVCGVCALVGSAGSGAVGLDGKADGALGGTLVW